MTLGRAYSAIQFSSSKPGTRWNSLRLLLTSTSPRLRAWPAIYRSLTPMGVPCCSRTARCCHSGLRQPCRRAALSGGCRNPRRPPDCGPGRWGSSASKSKPCCWERQPTTPSGRCDFRKAAGQVPRDSTSFAAPKLPFVTSRTRPEADSWQASLHGQQFARQRTITKDACNIS